MVNYENIVSELEKKNTLSLFVVVQMDELVNTWTVIFAADWVNEKNLPTTYKEISNLIDKNGSQADIAKVSRIGIFDSNHYLVKGIMKYSDEKELRDVKINGNTIHSGTIFYPRREKKKVLKEKINEM